MPKDYIGQELAVNDFVAFAEPGTKSMVVGVIMSLSKQMATMYHAPGKHGWKESRQFHKQLIKVHPKIIQNYIAKDDLVPGETYLCNARNFKEGVWNGHVFEYMRTKFTRVFLDTERHYDEGPPHGTVKPLMLKHW